MWVFQMLALHGWQRRMLQAKVSWTAAPKQAIRGKVERMKGKRLPTAVGDAVVCLHASIDVSLLQLAL